MAKQDTSQNAFCKNSLHKVQDITQQVNNSTAKIRLQGAKLFETAQKKELLVLDFYPLFKDLAWVYAEGDLVAGALDNFNKESLSAIKTPFLLYLKAHYVGHPLKNITQLPQGLEFGFVDGRSFLWNFSTQEFVFRVPDKKDYIQRLPFWSKAESLLNTNTEKKNEKNPSTELREESTKEDLKLSQLKKNIENDKNEADLWLRNNKLNIEKIFSDPLLWGADVSSLEVPMVEWQKQIAVKVPWSTPRKVALEKLKLMLVRYERKSNAANKRLAQVLSGSVKPKRQLQEKNQTKEVKASKVSVGKKVLLVDTLHAIVGKTAIENDELYRKASSRDLWFHVRGHKGAHVWIRRGQPLFGAKDELTQQQIEMGAVLAAKYSKASGDWIAVDYTERRYLKKLKGSPPGALQVLQSKTIFVSLGGK